MILAQCLFTVRMQGKALGIFFKTYPLICGVSKLLIIEKSVTQHVEYCVCNND